MSICKCIASLSRRFVSEKRAAAATEYAFLMAAVIIVAVSALSALGEGVKSAHETVTEEISHTP